MRFTIYDLRFTILSLFVGLLLFAVPVYAQGGTATDDDVNEVAKDLFCPVCESTPLDVCATQACADWRELIREKLTAGETKEEIFDYFALQYGDGVLAAPPQRGFNLVLWFFPVVAVLVGGFLFFRYIQNLRGTEDDLVIESSRSPVVTHAKQPKATLEEYIKQVETELGES